MQLHILYKGTYFTGLWHRTLPPLLSTLVPNCFSIILCTKPPARDPPADAALEGSTSMCEDVMKAEKGRKADLKPKGYLKLSTLYYKTQILN